MYRCTWKHLFAAAALCIAGSTATAANHLLISKVGVHTPGTTEAAGTGEYIEIHNPTNAPISLDNYLLTDFQDYYKLPETGFPVSTALDDFILKFPAGHTLAPGQTAVVVQSARILAYDYYGIYSSNVTLADLQPFFDQQGSPLLFEVTNPDNPHPAGKSVDGIPKMEILTNNTFANSNDATSRKWNLTLTNGGEFVCLFYWPTTEPLVKDVDIVAWGNPSTANSFPNKSGVSITVNGTPHTYAAEMGSGGSGGNLIVSPASVGGALRRIKVEEPGESIGGNGFTGHDETTELSAVSWTVLGHVDVSKKYPPGFVQFDNQPIISAERSITYPTPTTPVIINAEIPFSGGTLTSAKVVVDTTYPNSGSITNVNMVNSGGNSWNANLGTFADKTYVKWHIEATDSTGKIWKYPQVYPYFKVFNVAATQVTSDDLVISEIMADPRGNDNQTGTSPHSEYFEIYNRTSQEIDLSYYRWSINPTDFRFNRQVIPQGVKIPAKGYLVIAGDKNLLLEDYVDDGLNPNYIVGFHETQPADLGMFPNSSNTVNFSHVNEYALYDSYTGTTLDSVTYAVNAAPWPTGANSTGHSLELENPYLTTVNNDDPANWRLSTAPLRGKPGAASNETVGGTPGKRNSVSPPPAAVGEWNLY